MRNQYLLLEDVDGLGRSGDIVTVKRLGFARNYLLPEKKAIYAEKHLVRLQQKLKDERAVRAVEDRKEAQAIAEQLVGKSVRTEVKVDAEGQMFGSVSQHDIANMLKEQLGFDIEKRFVILPKPIKKLGVHTIPLKLKEGVPSSITLEIVAEIKPAE